MRCLVEICVSDIDSAVAARDGGADRIELCADLASGGVTPSAGLIAEAIERSGLPTHVLIRARPGDFEVGLGELAVMRRDIELARSLGAAGVVLGVLGPDGSVDAATVERLVKLARPMSVTFHKAIDLVPDPLVALDLLSDIGVDRVLTSGGPCAAREHLGVIRSMVERAGTRLVVMAGGGIKPDDLPRLIAETGVAEIHLGSGVTGPNPPMTPFGRRPRPVDEGLVRGVMARVGLESWS